MSGKSNLSGSYEQHLSVLVLEFLTFYCLFQAWFYIFTLSYLTFKGIAILDSQKILNECLSPDILKNSIGSTKMIVFCLHCICRKGYELWITNSICASGQFCKSVRSFPNEEAIPETIFQVITYTISLLLSITSEVWMTRRFSMFTEFLDLIIGKKIRYTKSSYFMCIWWRFDLLRWVIH